MASRALFDNLNVVPQVVIPVTPHQAEFDNLNVPLGAPGPVTGLTATVMGSSAIALAWVAPFGAVATVYTITAVPATPGGAFTTPGLSAVFTGLTSATLYVFTVVATNVVGSSTLVTVSATTNIDQTAGGTVSPPPVQAIVILQPTGQAFPATYAFRPENFGKTASQVSI